MDEYLDGEAKALTRTAKPPLVPFSSSAKNRVQAPIASIESDETSFTSSPTLVGPSATASHTPASIPNQDLSLLSTGVTLKSRPRVEELIGNRAGTTSMVDLLPSDGRKMHRSSRCGSHPIGCSNRGPELQVDVMENLT